MSNKPARLSDMEDYCDDCPDNGRCLELGICRATVPPPPSAARPSEPSAPPAAKDRDDSPRLTECPTCHKPYTYIAGIFRPVRTCKCGPSAPRLDIGGTAACSTDCKNGVHSAECIADHAKAAAPQPVSGYAPKVEEIAWEFIAHVFPSMDRQQAQRFIEQGASILRPYFPPASQTPELESPLPWTTSGDSPENPPMIWAADGDSIVNQMPDGTPYFEPEVARFIVRVANLATPASTARTDGWVSIVQDGPFPESDVQVEWCDITTKFRCYGEYRGEGTMWNGYQRYNVWQFTHWRKAEPLPAAPGSVPQAPKCSEPRVVELNPPNAPDKYAVFIGKVFIWEFDYEKEAEELRDNLKRGVPQAEPPKEGE